MLLFLFKSHFCINIKNQIVMDGDKQKVNELTMRTLGSHYGGYAYVKVKNRQADVKIDWKLLRAIEEGEVEIDNEKYHLSGIEYVAKRKDDGELIIKALSKDKSVLLNDFIIYVNNNGSIDEEDYDLLLTK